MKKLFKYFILILLLFSFSFKNVNAASETLADLKNELAKLKREQAESDSKKKKTQSEINEENSKIANANAAVKQAESDLEVAKKKIEESNAEIEKTKDESEKLLVFYQMIMRDENVASYITDASSMTDMVLRINAVSQILDYNNDKLSSLEDLIIENKDLQVELTKKGQELEENIKNYEKSLSSLKNDLSSLLDVSLKISEQIEAQQEYIEALESLGCKDNDKISVCAPVTDSTRWLKPTEKGYISSGFGYRSFYLNGKPYSDFHNALDIAGNSGGTNVYAAANGTIAAVIKKSSCGGNQIYMHVRVNGEEYTLTYAHLMEIKVNVGDYVTQQTVIGTVGGGGKTLKVNGGWDTCSTGYHLHFGVAKGFYLGGGKNSYSSYSKYVSNSIVPPFMPAYGKWYYTRY